MLGLTSPNLLVDQNIFTYTTKLKVFGANYGVKVDIPPVATPPDGPVIRNMLTMWSRVVTSH